MASVTVSPRVVVRAARPGEGRKVAALWRELWETHEIWGGYAASRNPLVYEAVAKRLDEDARARVGHPTLGRHVHLVAELSNELCGQVEGWLDQLGADSSTPMTCEVRSLIVHEGARRLGVGRSLLESLDNAARLRAAPSAHVLAAEVLELNPAQRFYARMGYAAVSWTARIDALSQRGPAPSTARIASLQDAPAIARLETSLAARRQAAGDVRFDRPLVADPSLVGSIAAHLASESRMPERSFVTLVAPDASGSVRAAATFAVQMLEPPFVSARRAWVGRFAFDAAAPSAPLLTELLSLSRRLAIARGADRLEVADLSEPGTELHDAALAAGARTWSRILMKPACYAAPRD
jgi:GNAT superfamily N-acetyltransferase